MEVNKNAFLKKQTLRLFSVA